MITSRDSRDEPKFFTVVFDFGVPDGMQGSIKHTNANAKSLI